MSARLGLLLTLPTLAAAGLAASGLGVVSTKPLFAQSSVVVQSTVADPPPLFEQATALEAVLPQSSVYDILEDHEGFLWFATREGVARWDGREVRSWRYDPFDVGSVPGNVVWTLAQDGRGDVWVTAYDYLQLPVGVARIVAPDFKDVRRYDFPGVAVALTPSGEALLVGTDSLWRHDPVRDRFEPWLARARPATGRDTHKVPPHTVLTDDGWLWIGDEGGLERCRLGAQAAPVAPATATAPASAAALSPPPACEPISDGTSPRDGPLLQARDGTVWAAEGSGLQAFDPADPAAGPHLTVELGAPVARLAEDSSGVVWVLSERGVDRVADGRVLARATLPVIGARSTLAAVALHVDRAQNVWVGTVWGVFTHQRARKAFYHLGHDPDDTNSLGSGLVSALAEGADGAIWIGTIGGGVNRWDRARDRVDRFRHGPVDSGNPAGPPWLPNDVVWDLEVDHAGTLWLATSDGLGRRPADGQRARSFARVPRELVPDGLILNSMQDLQLDATGRIWAPCPNGCVDTLPWFDPESATFRVRRVDGLRGTGYLGVAPDGRLWVGTADGIDRVDPDTGARERLPDTGGLDGVLAFHFSRGGDAWVGANSGLYRFGAGGHLIERYTTADGLPSNAVYGVLEDDRRRLWVSTNRGLAMVDPDEPLGAKVRTYDRTTGIGNVEFNRNAYLEARDGTFFFGGDRGVTWFHPARIRENPYAPPVVVTAVERATQSGSRREPLGPDATVRVRPDEYTFAFDFAALSYVNPHRNRYRAMLDGFDAQWQDLGTASRATYTNVPPGDYTFRVRGSNEDGVWGPLEARVRVRVEPSVYETTWFRAGVLALFGTAIAVVAVLLSRTRYRAELVRARAAQALERERVRLSRDMHDEVGASLTEIAILSDMTLAQAGAPRPVLEQLKRIGRKSRGALDAIGGIIWAIDPVNDGRRVGAYLREYAAEMLESAGLAADLDFPPTSRVPDVGAEARRTLLLVLKEALANVIRHADATRVSVRLTVEPDALRLVIRDDGRGLPAGAEPEAGPASGHDGLRNMRERAAAAGGTLRIGSPPTGAGTEVDLRLPGPEVEP